VEVSHGRAAGTGSRQQTETFTGDVWADPVIVGVDGASVHHVFFAPGSRTYWHTHEAGQVLQITSGAGRVVSRKQGVVEVRAGDVVFIEPGEVHWHGAARDSYLVHTATSLGGHEWLEEVSETDYEAATR
jgi:quercetin dioxygenase-like cupin family protein